jgi:hypothetical protein
MVKKTKTNALKKTSKIILEEVNPETTFQNFIA